MSFCTSATISKKILFFFLKIFQFFLSYFLKFQSNTFLDLHQKNIQTNLQVFLGLFIFKPKPDEIDISAKETSIPPDEIS